MTSSNWPFHAKGVCTCTKPRLPLEPGTLRSSQEDFLVCMKGRMAAVLTEADAVGHALVGPASDGVGGTQGSRSI